MLTLCGDAASRFPGPAFGCPAAFGIVFAALQAAPGQRLGPSPGTDSPPGLFVSGLSPRGGAQPAREQPSAG